MSVSVTSPLVEFAGSPRSGKDTLIARLAGTLRSRQLRCYVANEGARTSNIDKANSAELLFWTIGRAASDFADAAVTSRNLIVTIFNRGVFDRLVWIRAYCSADLISKSQAQHWERFLLSRPSELVPHQVFLFITPPEIVLERARDTQYADGGAGRVLNHTFLQTLNECYVACAEEHATRFPRIELIDERESAISLNSKFERISAALFRSVHA